MERNDSRRVRRRRPGASKELWVRVRVDRGSERDQPNNDVRMTLEGGSGGGNSFRIGDSSSAGFSDLFSRWRTVSLRQT